MEPVKKQELQEMTNTFVDQFRKKKEQLIESKALTLYRNVIHFAKNNPTKTYRSTITFTESFSELDVIPLIAKLRLLFPDSFIDETHTDVCVQITIDWT